jgi:DNA-binding CsgD family transcriptional regulator
MPQITNFVLIFSLGVGLAAIAVSAQMYRRYRLGYLRAHLAIVIGFNLMIFFNIIALYIFNLPDGSVPDSVERATGIGLEFLVPLLQLLAAYFFLQIIRGMLGRPLNAGVKRGAGAVIIGYAVVQAIAMTTSPVIGGIHLHRIISRLAWISTLGFICVVLLAALGEARAIGDRKKKNAIKAYCLLIFGLISLVIILIVLNFTGILTVTRYNFLTGFLIVVMNAVPILYLGWFAERFHDRPKIDWRIDEDAAILFDSYGISPRERDIVRLICSGRTNRQIADELFISLQTVKDHAYRIFRKTGVKNRVQLAHLFMNASNALPEEDQH